MHGLNHECRDALSKLAVHVEIASRVNTAVDAFKLVEISTLEQSIGNYFSVSKFKSAKSKSSHFYGFYRILLFAM